MCNNFVCDYLNICDDADCKNCFRYNDEYDDSIYTQCSDCKHCIISDGYDLFCEVKKKKI